MEHSCNTMWMPLRGLVAVGVQHCCLTKLPVPKSQSLLLSGTALGKGQKMDTCAISSFIYLHPNPVPVPVISWLQVQVIHSSHLLQKVLVQFVQNFEGLGEALENLTCQH